MFSTFLEELKEKNIDIHFAEGKLQYSGPEDSITPDLLERMKHYKPKLIKHFWPAECHNLMPINTEGDKAPFILVHGDQTNYYLSEHFGKNQPFYGFFHYGSDGTRIKHKSVKTFVEDYIQQIQIVVPEGPYLLAGFSFGGTLAFEIATELQKRGYEVSMLVLIDSKNTDPAYDEPAKKTDPSLIKKTIAFLNTIWLKFYYKGLKLYFRSYHFLGIPLPDKHRNQYIATKYVDLMRKHKPSKVYKGNILVFRATENPTVHKYLGWEKLCDDIELITIKGNHDSIKKIDLSIESLKKNIHKRLVAVQNELESRSRNIKHPGNATKLYG